jgi:hypothetical protein
MSAARKLVDLLDIERPDDPLPQLGNHDRDIYIIELMRNPVVWLFKVNLDLTSMIQGADGVRY